MNNIGIRVLGQFIFPKVSKPRKIILGIRVEKYRFDLRTRLKCLIGEKGRSVMAYIWPIYGLYMAYTRPIYGPYMAYIWPIHGL